MGRLKFRTSYGQNQHAHAIEASRLAVIIANEVGADIETVREAALLHEWLDACVREAPKAAGPPRRRRDG